MLLGHTLTIYRTIGKELVNMTLMNAKSFVGRWELTALELIFRILVSMKILVLYKSGMVFHRQTLRHRYQIFALLLRSTISDTTAQEKLLDQVGIRVVIIAGHIKPLVRISHGHF